MVQFIFLSYYTNMLKEQEILNLLNSTPEGYLEPSDKFFANGNSTLFEPYRKLGAINNSEVNELKDIPINNPSEIFCNVPKCSLVFDNVAAYQSHYNSVHRFICSECKKSLPTEHLLDLHLTESHDTYFEVRVERGERLYKCYLEECKDMFANAPERKEHCIHHHNFPSNFRFDRMVFKGKKSAKTETEDTMHVEADQLLFSTVKAPIKYFSFGHQKEKTFQFKTDVQNTREPGKTLDLDSLKEAIDSV